MTGGASTEGGFGLRFGAAGSAGASCFGLFLLPGGLPAPVPPAQRAVPPAQRAVLQRDLGQDVVTQVAQHSAGVGQVGAVQVYLVVRGGRRSRVVRRVGKLLAG